MEFEQKAKLDAQAPFPLEGKLHYALHMVTIALTGIITKNVFLSSCAVHRRQ